MNKAECSGAYLFVLPWELGDGGGVNQVVENLMLRMQQRAEYQPILLSCDWVCPEGLQGEAEGVPWYNLLLREPAGRWQNWRQHLSFLSHGVQALWMLRNLFKNHCVRVVNLHHPVRGQLLIAWAAHLLRRHLIISLHGAELMSAEQATGMARWHWRLMFSWAVQIVCCSNALAERFKGSFPEFAGKCMIIANGIDPRLLETKKAHGVACHESDNKVILSTGTFEWKKGQDILLQAYAQLPQAMQDDYDLVLLGRQGPALSQLQTWLTESEIAERVFFYTDVSHENVLATMQTAAIFVLPSRQEPFGIVLLEAGCSHLPIIASRVGGIPEVVVDGETGLLVASDNSAALAEAMAELILDMDRAQTLAEKMYYRVQHFTWDGAYSQYIALAGPTRPR